MRRNTNLGSFSKLNPEMLYRQLQYFAEENGWTEQGEQVLTGGCLE